MRRLMTVAVLAASLALLSVSGTAAASVPMKLDPSFGVNGMVTVDIAGATLCDPSISTCDFLTNEDEPFTLIMQPDGKFVTPGKAFNAATGNFDFAVIRYNSDGSLDKSFDGDGIVLTNIQGGYDEGLGIVMQSDGKLAVSGLGRNPSTRLADFAVVRYNPDGSLDPSFGNGGKAITDFFGGDDKALGLVMQSDGKLVAGGLAISPTSGMDFALARYNTDGSLDPSFGNGGKVTTDFFGSTDAIYRLGIQADDKPVAVGLASNTITGNRDFGLARYNSDGSLDTSFGNGGKVTTDFIGGNDYALTVLPLPDGKILAGGLAFNNITNSNDFALARYNADGSLDTTFATYGKAGVVTTDFFGNYDQILALAVQPDGKILAAGHAKHPTRNFEFALARYNADGTVDSSFGYGGRLTLDWFGGPDGIHGLVLQPDGKAVVAGDTRNPSTGGDDFATARFRIADPSWLRGVVAGLPDSAFLHNPDGSTNRSAMLTLIDQAQASIDAGAIQTAIWRLLDLRRRVDGCPPGNDANDWIVDCTVQLQLRALIDQINNKLSGK